MLFNSLEFLIFFPIAVIAYFLLPRKRRWVWLIAASCFFYIALTPYYIIVLFSIVIVSYCMGLLIDYCRNTKKGKPLLFLITGIVYPLAVLFIFKYFNFFSETITELAKLLRLNYHQKVITLLLPVGISFYTLQSMSYLIEVYRGNQKAERHFGIYSLFIIFFPKVVAGPIERPQNLLQQLRKAHDFDYASVAEGFRIMAWGFFKKLVIADRLAVAVNEIFNNVHDYSGIYFITAAVFFSIQIYCDFSGYSDIAVGAARIMGFRLADNFKRPFLATSMRDLWRRWHISLTSWLKDYIYIPIGGSRLSRWRWQYNIIIIFLLSGLWHGANWTFLLWAALNCLFLILSIWTSGIRGNLARFIRLDRLPALHTFMARITTFGLFTFSLIFFRANSISEGIYIVTHLFSGLGSFITAILSFNYELIKASLIVQTKNTIFGFAKPSFLPEIIVAFLAILAMLIVEVIQEKGKGKPMAERSTFARWTLYILLASGIIFLGMFAEHPFIYFRF